MLIPIVQKQPILATLEDEKGGSGGLGEITTHTIYTSFIHKLVATDREEAAPRRCVLSPPSLYWTLVEPGRKRQESAVVH